MRTLGTFRPDRALPLIVLGFTVFALCFQGSFYLFDYRNGDSLAPTSFKLLKDAALVAVIGLALFVGLSRKRRTDAPLTSSVPIIIFCALVTLTKLVEWATYGTTNVLLLTVKNLVMYAALVPAFSLLDDDTKRRAVQYVMVAVVAVAFAQVLFSAALFVFCPGCAFWTDDPYTGFNPFVGLMANPNRFALFLNLAAAALCTVLVISSARYALLAAAGLIVLAIGNFYTATLSQLIVYFGLLFYATAITALRMRWRSTRFLAVGALSLASIFIVGANFKSPMPDETHKESALAFDLRNIASLAIRGSTIDGEPFKFTSDSFVNRISEISSLMDSLGVHHSGQREPAREGTRRPLHQKLFGMPERMAPANQSQFIYIYFRYGLIGLALFAVVLFLPAAGGLLTLLRSSEPWLLSYHLCLVVFIATFLGDNGLLDFPTNFLLFLVIFANHFLAPYQKLKALYNWSAAITRKSAISTHGISSL